MKTLRTHLILLVSILLIGCTQQVKKPTNVIYVIGDGMGFGAVSALLLTEDTETGFEMAPVIGLNETCSANIQINIRQPKLIT